MYNKIKMYVIKIIGIMIEIEVIELIKLFILYLFKVYIYIISYSKCA